MRARNNWGDEKKELKTETEHMSKINEERLKETENLRRENVRPCAEIITKQKRKYDQREQYYDQSRERVESGKQARQSGL